MASKIISISKLEKKADRLFSNLRRIQESDENGYCYCISCGVRKHYKEMDAGHWIGRGHKSTRYEPNNVWPQCKKCNWHLHGNNFAYKLNLEKIIGREGIEELERKGKAEIYFYRDHLEKVISNTERILKIERARCI